jgi:hypothetical protein
MAGEFLDLSSEPELVSSAGDGTPGRRFLGIQFACCGIYARIYVNKEKTAYVGNCPRCAKRVVLKIGPGGTDSRFFTVY